MALLPSPTKCPLLNSRTAALVSFASFFPSETQRPAGTSLGARSNAPISSTSFKPPFCGKNLLGGLRSGIVTGPTAKSTPRCRGIGEAANSSVEEEDDGDKFVELEEEMDSAYGPPAVLLLGISSEDKDKIKAALVESEAEFISVASVTDEMLQNMTLWDAMQAADAESQKQNDPSPPSLVPSIGSFFNQGGSISIPKVKGFQDSVGLCLISGLTGEETMLMVEIVGSTLSHLGENGLAFAAMLPKFSQRMLKDVVSDVLGDHAANADPSKRPAELAS